MAQENAENLPPNSQTSKQERIHSFFQSLTTLATRILELIGLNNVKTLIESAIRDLREEYGEYDGLLKVLTALAVENAKLNVEIKSLIETVKEQAQTSTKIIEEAERQLLEGKNISTFLVEIETMAKKTQTSLTELKNNYGAIIDKVKDCLSKARSGYDRNERKADLVREVAIPGCCGMGIGGMLCGCELVPTCMRLFGPQGALMLAVLAIFDGFGIGWMTVDIPSSIYGNQYQKLAKKSKGLYATLWEIVQILLENFKVLTDIGHLLDKLKTQDMFNAIRQDENSHTEDDEDTVRNTNFLIGLRLDSFKNACEKLEKACDCFIDNMPLNCATLLPGSEECNYGSTTGKDKKDN